jgi:phospholipid/cholesterol/gamma-HCH transport system substrate-binding protein
MRSNRNLEIGTGFFVLLGFAALAFLTTQLPSSGIKLNGAKSGYFVTAKFDNIGDLKAGSPVSMAGVRIGDVASIKFDPQDYKAAVTLRIDNQFNQIPDDSDASIQTQGLLGGKYIGIGPGGSEEYLKDGSTIPFTQSAIVLESLVNKFFANMASRGSESNGGSSGQSSSGQSPSNNGSSAQNDETGGDAGKETQK